MKKILLFSLLLSSTISVKAQLQVSVDSVAINLADALVGSGVNITNAVLTCGSGASGTFSNGFTTNLGMDDGIVLMSGPIDSISKPSTYYLSGGGIIPGDGDAALDTISMSITYNACVLEFDITISGTTLLMDYVFASEEYPEFVCAGPNDIFAFQISGPNPLGGNYTNLNIATVPGTTSPISIKTINGGPIYCLATNYAYYIDNLAGTNIAFDGFTTPLTATVPTVPGQTYHMRYAVADASDHILDTGVFLEAGGLKSTGTPTGIAAVVNTQLAALYPNPSNGEVNVYSKEKNKALDIQVYNGIGQRVLMQHVDANGTTMLDLTMFGAGMYMVSVSNGTAVETHRVQVL